jgi:hypothetical protein
MKTTLDIPEDVLRSVEVTAAARGEAVREFVIRALEAHVRSESANDLAAGWRSVFGRAQAADVDAVDRVIAAEFEEIDPAEWQ